VKPHGETWSGQLLSKPDQPLLRLPSENRDVGIMQLVRFPPRQRWPLLELQIPILINGNPLLSPHKIYRRYTPSSTECRARPASTAHNNH